MMRALFERFKKKTEAPGLPTGEVAWSEPSAIYSVADFEKYNPDELIGRKGFKIYRKMMSDEQVKAVIKFKRDAITSRDYFFDLDGEQYGLSREEVDRRIDISYAILDKMQGSWMDGLNYIMSAMYQGFSMTEKLFRQIEVGGLTWWGLGGLKLRPYDTFFFKVDGHGNVLQVVQKVGSKEIKVDPRKFIHFVVNPDVDEHYGMSELREAYRAWFSKDVIIKFRNMWLERHAGGLRWIQAKDGKMILPGTQEYLNLQNILNNINTSTGMILPNNVDFNSQYPNNNVAFKEAIEDSDLAIARALIVPNLVGITPTGQTGSYSQSQTQLDAFMWTLEADTARLEDAVNEQLFKQLGDVNFGDGAWPRFKFKPISGSRKLEIVRVWKDLVSASAVSVTENDEEHIRDLLDFPEYVKEEQQVTPTPVSEPTQPNISGETTQPDTSGETTQPDTIPIDATEETIRGKALISTTAEFTRALRRVDFAVIAKASDSITDDHTTNLASIMDVVISDLIDKARSGGELNSKIKDNIRKVKTDSKLKRKLNSAVSAMLRDGFRTGLQHAKIEVDKAKKEAFSRRYDSQRLDMIAEDYFQTTSFKITGDLTSEAESIIEQEILNGARYDKTWQEVEQSIYRSFATKGMISLEQAKDALGEALNVTSPDARLRTIVRTSTFDAINNARYGYFTDPELGDFVQAFEYSAILDSRTTQICRHLDEEDRGNHSKEWYDSHPEYRPPNHYNCRSLLVPVTQADMDSFVEGPEPTIEPQEGFR